MENRERYQPSAEAERGFDVISAAACFVVTTAFTYYGVKQLNSPYPSIREGAVGAGVIAFSFAGIGWHKFHNALWPQDQGQHDH
jgi:hypothetical protein